MLLSEGGNLYLVGHETLGQWNGAAWAYYLPDALGSVRQVTDGAGAVVSAREWTPYGVQVGSAQAGLGYAGEWYDPNVMMVYLRARWYDDSTGRFTSQDPFPGLQTQPLSLHPYLYVLANPVNYTDPTGAQSILDSNGYAEGWSFSISGLLMALVIRGEEIVYDFATMERARFTFTGRVATGLDPGIPTGFCLSLLNASAAPYFSYIWGFDEEGIEIDYSGPFLVGQLGPDIPIPIPELAGLVSVGGGMFGFSSVYPGTTQPNLDVFGAGFYADVSVGSGVWDLPLTLAVFVTDYEMKEETRKHYDSIDEMVQDVRSGDGSPIWWLPLGRVREFVAQETLEWYEIQNQQ